MNIARCSFSVALIGLAIAATSRLSAQAPEAVPLDQRDMQAAGKLLIEGKYADALKFYEGVPQKYPSSLYIPEANLRTAICYYFLKNYDKAIEAADKNTKLKTPPAQEILERTYVLIPQIYLAKAEAMKPDDPLRTETFQDAIRAFDDVVKKFPASEEVESANYGKGRAQLMIDQFDAAAESFRANLQKFPQSPSVLDSQFLLAVALTAKAGKALAAQTAEDATIAPALEEADRLLRDIDQKRTDLALANRARFQLGGVLAARATLAKRGSPEQIALQKSALDAFRAVAPKEVVVQLQDARVKYFEQKRVESRDVPSLKRFERLIEKEREKSEVIKSEADQSIAAKISAAKIFVTLGKFDEARVLLRFAEGFITGESEEEKDQKKQILYLTTVTYAAQAVVDKAVEGYTQWQASFPKDPMGQNLALLIGGAFLAPDAKKKDPEKAIKYFDEQIANFPESAFSAEAAMQKSSAYIAEGNFDKALEVLQQFISSSKNPELLAQAEFNLAIIYSQTGKSAEAVKTFKNVRDKYPGSEQAEQAGFYLGQTLYGAGDGQGSLDELNNFIARFPQSALIPQAYYFKARALGKLGKKHDSLVAYAKVAADFPDSEVAVPSFFERAGTLLNDEKPDEAAKVMREFIAKYPNAPQVYQAFSFIADVHVSRKQSQEAIKVYEEYLAAYPGHPLASRAYVALANLWKKEAENIGGYLAINAEEKKQWAASLENAIKHAETAIKKFPDTDAVSQALQVLLGIEQLRMTVGVRKADEVEKYFTDLAGEFEGQGTKSKILFALAGFFAAKDDQRSFEIMKKAYDPQLVYAPEDLDLYGNLLVNHKETGEALRVAEKLAADYPLPPNVPPEKATRTIGTAQANAMALRARILQAENKAAEGQKVFEQLKQFYPWSAKVAEADFGIGAGLFEQKKYDEAVEILADVAAKNAAPPPLRAKAMLLLAKALEAQKIYDQAINNYLKTSLYFKAEEEIAAEALWLGAQLLEKQATGEIPMPAKKASAKTAAKARGGKAPPAKSRSEPKPAPAAPKAAGAPKPEPAKATAAAQAPEKA